MRRSSDRSARGCPGRPRSGRRSGRAGRRDRRPSPGAAAAAGRACGLRAGRELRGGDESDRGDEQIAERSDPTRSGQAQGGHSGGLRVGRRVGVVSGRGRGSAACAAPPVPAWLSAGHRGTGSPTGSPLCAATPSLVTQPLVVRPSSASMTSSASARPLSGPAAAVVDVVRDDVREQDVGDGLGLCRRVVGAPEGVVRAQDLVDVRQGRDDVLPEPAAEAVRCSDGRRAC